MKKLILAMLLLVFFTVPLVAGDVGLAWDASVSAGVTNYRVYTGNAPGVYHQSYTIGNLLTYKVIGLATGTWYFAVTAIDGQANESGFSNEVSQVITGGPAAPAAVRFPPVVISNTNPPPKTTP